MSSAPGPIAVAGLGAMGLPMARRLIDAGFEVRGTDRDAEACQRIAAFGGIPAPDAAVAAAGARALLITVVSADQAEQVLFGPDGAAAALAPQAVVILSVTMAPEHAAGFGRLLADAGVAMLDCPVSGGIKRAAAGTLSLLASGPPTALELARPYLSALGGTVFEIGPAHGQASAVKLLNQILCAVHLAAAGEVIALAERAGIDPQTVYDVVVASSGASWMFADRVPAMIAGAEEGQRTAAIDILLKDIRLATGLGRSVGAALPLAIAAEALFSAASAAGLGQHNDSAIIEILRGRRST